MYRDEILDHYKRPRNEGQLDTKYEAEGENPSCGDDTHIYLEVENGEVIDFRHSTEACAICTAGVSILSEEIVDRKISEVRELDKDWMIDRLGIDISPMRMKCALLGLETVQKALNGQE